jgi:hypothetical protein
MLGASRRSSINERWSAIFPGDEKERIAADRQAVPQGGGQRRL